MTKLRTMRSLRAHVGAAEELARWEFMALSTRRMLVKETMAWLEKEAVSPRRTPSSVEEINAAIERFRHLREGLKP